MILELARLKFDRASPTSGVAGLPSIQMDRAGLNLCQPSYEAGKRSFKRLFEGRRNS